MCIRDSVRTVAKLRCDHPLHILRQVLFARLDQLQRIGELLRTEIKRLARTFCCDGLFETANLFACAVVNPPLLFLLLAADAFDALPYIFPAVVSIGSDLLNRFIRCFFTR